MRVAIYARISTDDQTLNQQTSALRDDCKRHKWNIVATISDTISGAKFTRAGLDKLMELVRKRKIDMVVCQKLDRLGRSLPHLAQMIGEFGDNGIALFVPGQGIDTRDNNPAGKLQMHVLMAVADFERSLISDRTKLKMQSLKKGGMKFGRPKISGEIVKKAETFMMAWRKKHGELPTLTVIAQAVGVSMGSAFKLRNRFEKTKR